MSNGFFRRSTRLTRSASLAAASTQGNGPLAGQTINYNLNLVNFDWTTWHQYEWENWATVDALLGYAIGYLNVRGVWQPNTEYVVGESVFSPDDVNALYTCIVDHLSGTDWATDEPLYWQAQSGPAPGVRSVFGREGVITAQSNDYFASQIGYVDAGTGYGVDNVQDAIEATKQYADDSDQALADVFNAQLDDYVAIDGTVAMTGPLSLPGDPIDDLHAATKEYVDTQDAAIITYVDGLQPVATELRIDDFLTSSGPFVDQTVALQDAVNLLSSNNAYVSLNLCGRVITVSDTIVYKMPGATFRMPIRIHNGAINANSNFPDRNAPLVRFDLNGNTRIEHMTMQDVTLLCTDNASGVLIDGDYLNVSLYNVVVRRPYAYGIQDDPNGAGGGLFMHAVKIIRPDGSVPFADRVTNAFIVNSGDCKMVQCQSIYCRTGLDSRRGSLIAVNCHFFQGYTGSGAPAFAEFNPCVITRAGYSSKYVGCYFDNSPVVVDLDGTNNVLYTQFQSCIFTIAACQADYRMLVLHNGASGGYQADGLALSHCTLRSFSTEHPSTAFGTTGTGILRGDNKRLTIDYTNSFWNVPVQTTEANIRIVFDGSTEYTFDFTDRAPFGIATSHYRLSAPQTGSSFGLTVPIMYIARDSGAAGRLVVRDSPVQGNVYLTAVWYAGDLR